MTKTAILTVSFGTTYPATRQATIGATEQTIQQAFPQAQIFRAFTSKIVIHRIQSHEGLHIDSLDEALTKIQAQGFDQLWIQSLHLIPGIEYEQVVAAADRVRSTFQSVVVGPPLLDTQADFLQVVSDLKQWYPDTQANAGVLWMGHGTAHQTFATYACLDHMLWGSKQYVGAVESYPGIDLEIRRLKHDGIERVTLQPFMLVAGNHAHQDMASSQPDSWQSQLEAAGIQVTPVLQGLGAYSEIQQLFVRHLRNAVNRRDTQ
ncbi:sirohydrochlorin cobaltochelatase [Levilactobacillus yiduensis]|uniref:sirohydrochlorin cobaltochelatase n=1 Tax=Levilactobacillus yiduensis TaxID=2953880 RepID=UPI000EF2D561|nr:sirohydrochlorin cobaltochelatase [Levilactobacillus yiduensis]AYM02462.1 sirohydrochlorin cobaltochelatase [Levilactobacillus brevis]